MIRDGVRASALNHIQFEVHGGSTAPGVLEDFMMHKKGPFTQLFYTTVFHNKSALFTEE